jgi:hypothetical protein
MRSFGGELQYLGMNHVPTKSTLSRINASRSYEFIEQLFYVMFNQIKAEMERAGASLADLADKSFSLIFNGNIIIVDATIINLTL